MAEQKAPKNLKLAAVLVTTLALVLTALFFFNAPKKTQKSLPPEAIISYQGLPADTTITAEISVGGKTRALTTTDKAFLLTPEQREDFYAPYNIKAQLHSEKNGYRDISWSLQSNGAQYSILADGFKPTDKISLSINGQTVITIPFDWSGRIEVPIILRTGMDTTTCITIEESSETLGFCHFATGRAA